MKDFGSKKNKTNYKSSKTLMNLLENKKISKE